METKTCIKCAEVKELELFAKGKNYVNGRKNTCKACHTAYVTQYYKDNPDQYKAQLARSSMYRPSWKRHGLTEDKYNELLAKYDGQCHACKVIPALNVDHDHNCCDKMFSCGKCIRGLLCHHCNTALGLMKDSVQNIQNLLDYIS
jgi:hypothetical protein